MFSGLCSNFNNNASIDDEFRLRDSVDFTDQTYTDAWVNFLPDDFSMSWR